MLRQDSIHQDYQKVLKDSGNQLCFIGETITISYTSDKIIRSVFFPALQGSATKMSASDSTSSIFLTDTKNEIKKKINKYAFSGGQTDIETHRKLGGDTELDIAYQYLRFFLEDDDELAELGEKYRKGIAYQAI